MNEINIKSQVSKSDFLGFWFSKLFKSSETKILYLIVSTVFVAGITGILPMKYVLTSFLVVMTFFVFLFLRYSQVYKMSDLYKNELLYTFSQNQLKIIGENLNRSLAYNNLHKIEWQEKLLILFIDAQNVVLIDRKQIDELEQLETLKNLLQSKN